MKLKIMFVLALVCALALVMSITFVSFAEEIAMPETKSTVEKTDSFTSWPIGGGYGWNPGLSVNHVNEDMELVDADYVGKINYVLHIAPDTDSSHKTGGTGYTAANYAENWEISMMVYFYDGIYGNAQFQICNLFGDNGWTNVIFEKGYNSATNPDKTNDSTRMTHNSNAAIAASYDTALGGVGAITDGDSFGVNYDQWVKFSLRKIEDKLYICLNDKPTCVYQSDTLTAPKTTNIQLNIWNGDNVGILADDISRSSLTVLTATTLEIACEDIVYGQTVAPQVTTNTSDAQVAYTYYADNNGVKGDKLQAAPTNAGTYWVQGSTPTTETHASAKSEAVKFTIAKATNTWTTELTCPSIEQGGTLAPNAAASVGTVTYKYSATEDGEYAEEAPTAVGDYYIKAYVTGVDNYRDLVSDAVAFSITEKTSPDIPKTEAELEITCADIVYGQTVTPQVTTNTSNAQVTYVYYADNDGAKGDLLEAAPTNAGTYYVEASTPETATHTAATSQAVKFTIAKATNEWTTELTCANIQVGGTLAPNAVAKQGTVTYKYCATEDGEYTTQAPTAAGNYFVKAYVTGLDNYKDLTSEAVAFSITAKADPKPDDSNNDKPNTGDNNGQEDPSDKPNNSVIWIVAGCAAAVIAVVAVVIVVVMKKKRS